MVPQGEPIAAPPKIPAFIPPRTKLSVFEGSLSGPRKELWLLSPDNDTTDKVTLTQTEASEGVVEEGTEGRTLKEEASWTC